MARTMRRDLRDQPGIEGRAPAAEVVGERGRHVLKTFIGEVERDCVSCLELILDPLAVFVVDRGD
jgi:hypothetical protein